MPLAILYNLREKSGTKNKDWQNYSNTFTKIPLPGEPPLVVPREQIIGKDSLKVRYRGITISRTLFCAAGTLEYCRIGA